MEYSQITLTERHQIQALKKLGFNAPLIATELNRHPTTIRRELKSKVDNRGWVQELMMKNLVTQWIDEQSDRAQQ